MRVLKSVGRMLPGLYLSIAVVIAFSFNQSDNGLIWTGFTTQ